MFEAYRMSRVVIFRQCVVLYLNVLMIKEPLPIGIGALYVKCDGWMRAVAGPSK